MDHVIDFEKHLCAFGIFSQNQAQKDSERTLLEKGVIACQSSI